MVRTIVVLTVLLTGLFLLLLVMTDDSPKRRIALHNPVAGFESR